MPRTGAPHIPKSLGPRGWGQPPARDRGNGLKAQPAAYRWTSGAGWALTAPTSREAVKVKAVNREPVSRPKGALALQGGEEASLEPTSSFSSLPP
jgi:transposase